MVSIRCSICSLLEEFNVHMEYPICMECLMPTCSVQIPHKCPTCCLCLISAWSIQYIHAVSDVYLCLVFTCSIQYAVNLNSPVFTSRIKCSMSMVPLNLGEVQLGPLSLGSFISPHLFRPTDIRSAYIRPT